MLRLRLEQAVVASGLALVAAASVVPWWSRPADEGEATPLSWLPPAANINLPLYAAAGTALLLLMLERVRPARSRRRRFLWALPLLLAGVAGLVAGVELGYLEVYDDARLGMPLGLGGIALLLAGSLLSVIRGRPPPDR